MNAVRFLLDDELVTVESPDPTGTLLDLLRYRLRRTGTKEGCAEGDCGACTVLVGEAAGETVAWRAVNACILFLPMLDGRALLTVESLRGEAPVQRAMAANGASQCGFCTPGFVMSLHGRAIGAAGADAPVEDVIAGNLCRCTGYGPILAAGAAVTRMPRDDRALAARLRGLAAGAMPHGVFADPLAKRERRWWTPRDLDELAALRIAQPTARIVAGATDVGLWVTKQLRVIDDLIFVGGVDDLRRIEEEADALTIGAAVRYTDAAAALARLHPELGGLVRRIGGLQVRNAGTIGGNIANGSPIGDMPPALIALGATLTLRRGAERRTTPLEDFFLDYGKQDLAEGEFVESVRIPRPTADTLVRVTKLSKRFDSDISAVCGAFMLRIADGVVREARVAFGGMAATPRRAAGCEAALTGQPWSEATVAAAARSLKADFTPRDDLRGSAAYRTRVAGNLLRRLWAADEPVSVLELADG